MHKHTNTVPELVRYNFNPTERMAERLHEIATMALQDLLAIYTELRYSLERYASYKGASESYILRQNQLLFQLTDVINVLERLTEQSDWLVIQSEMNKLLGLDPRLEAVIVNISFCPKPKQIGYITINSYVS